MTHRERFITALERKRGHVLCTLNPLPFYCSIKSEQLQAKTIVQPFDMINAAQILGGTIKILSQATFAALYGRLF